MFDFYALLGCPSNVEPSALKAAYHNYLRRVHPDKGGCTVDAAAVNLAQRAYQTLKNRDTRISYDRWLREQRLREEKELISEELVLEPHETSLETECRCGALFEVSAEELAKVCDYALFECSSCSLCLKNNNKVLLLGDAGVGKSTLVNTLCGKPDSRPESTVGVSIKVLAHQFAAGTPQEATEVIELWDVGGANVHRQTAARVFSENVSGIIFVHDLSNSRSEENLSAWATLLEESAHGFGGLLGAGGSPQRYGDFNRLPDMEQIGYLPTLVVGSYLDLAPQRAKDRGQKLRFLRHYEQISLDCRKEIAPGSTNRLLVSRFFDTVCVVKSRLNDPTSQRRRRLQ